MTAKLNGSLIDEVQLLAVPRRVVVGLRERVAVANLPAFFGRALPVVLREMSRQAIRPSGPPLTIYRDEAGGEFEVTVGFPVEVPASPVDVLVVDELPDGTVVQAEHVGPYETLPGRMRRWASGSTSTGSARHR
jgi:hypothetical protein